VADRPELDPDGGEPLIRRRLPAIASKENALEAVAFGPRGGATVVVGAQNRRLLRSTLHGALAEGMTVPGFSDAHHDRRPGPMGGAAPDTGHHPYQLLYLDPSDGAGADRRYGEDPGRRLQRRARKNRREVDDRRLSRPPNLPLCEVLF